MSYKIAIIIGIVTVLLVTFLVLYFLHKSRWPVHFSLTADVPTVTVDIYANDMMAFKSQTIKQGQTCSFQINNNNVPNVRTGKTVTRQQLTHIVIYVPVVTKIQFDSGNLPKHNVILSKDRAGFSVIEQNVNGIWTKAGYYTVNFPSGIPYF